MNREIIEAEIEQLLGKCGWTHKIQEKQAEIYHNRRLVMELTRIGVSAITTSGVLAVLMGEQKWGFKLITAIFALVSTGINLFFQKYDYVSLEKEHKASAVKWLGLREDYTALISEIRANVISDEEILTRKRALLELYKQVSIEAPITTDKAYKKAATALKINLDDVITKDEVNIFLADKIRKG